MISSFNWSRLMSPLSKDEIAITVCFVSHPHLAKILKKSWSRSCSAFGYLVRRELLGFQTRSQIRLFLMPGSNPSRIIKNETMNIWISRFFFVYSFCFVNPKRIELMMINFSLDSPTVVKMVVTIVDSVNWNRQIKLMTNIQLTSKIYWQWKIILIKNTFDNQRRLKSNFIFSFSRSALFK